MLRGRSVPSPVRFTSQKEWPYPPSSGAELAVSDCAVGLLLFDAMCFDALQAMHGGGGDGDAERAPATGGDQDGERAATSTSAIEKHLGFHSLLPFTSEVRFTREPRETTQRSSRRARQRNAAAARLRNTAAAARDNATAAARDNEAAAAHNGDLSRVKTQAAPVVCVRGPFHTLVPFTSEVRGGYLRRAGFHEAPGESGPL